MTDDQDLRSMMGRNAVDVEGTRIGKIGQIYLDDQTGEPQWVTIQTGMFGNKESFAPLNGSKLEGDAVKLAVSQSLVTDAPNLDADGHLDQHENEQLYRHYADYLATGSQQTDTGRGEYREDVAGRTGVVGRDTSGPTTDDAMTRSEERLRVGTETVEIGRARLRKYIVTEQVTQTVPVRREEVRIEREAITDANRDAAMSGVDISEAEHEVTLHAERPVAAKETVPVERVRLATETVTEHQDVTETVRKEQIDDGTVDIDRTDAPR